MTAANIATALGYAPVKPEDVPSFSNKSVLDAITGIVTPEKLTKPDHATDLVQYDAFQAAAQRVISQIPTVPEALKNPNALTFTGAASGSYDGSAAKTVNIPTVPTALKNPNALTIKIGSTTVTYDGSSAQTVEIADGTEVSY